MDIWTHYNVSYMVTSRTISNDNIIWSLVVRVMTDTLKFW